MSQFPLARIREFVGRVVPFDSLDDDELSRVVQLMDIAYYPRGETIIRVDGRPAGHLHIIHSGSIRIDLPSDSGQDILIDIRGEGDVFGAVSVLSSRKALFNVTAREDVLAFLLPSDNFRQLVDRHPSFQRHFKYSLARNLESAAQPPETRLGRMAGMEALKDMAAQMRKRVGGLMTRRVLTCPRGEIIRRAAMEMTRRGVGSIVVIDPAGTPLGIITDTDLRSRVMAGGMSLEDGVEQVMSRPPLAISHNAYAFEAMLDMTRHGVHHLLVMEGGQMVGIISDHDINVVTGSSPVGLVREIDKISTLDEMERLPSHIRRLQGMLLRLGSSAEYVMDLLSEIIDRLTLKMFTVAERGMRADGLGPPPADYSWLALDSSGRREQAPFYEQSSALVYSDVPPDKEGVVKEWFLGFARRVSEGLAICGRPHCSLGLMAREPVWCRGISDWQKSSIDWISGDEPFDLGKWAGFFDLRPVTGEGGALASWRTLMWEAMSENDGFFGRLALAGKGRQPPIGFLRQNVVERDGRAGEVLNLAELVGPVVSGLRVWAWRHRVADTNTLGRLAALTSEGAVPANLAADIREAFSFITILRISRFLETESLGGGL